MSYKIIQTEDYLLIVDDSQITEGDWHIKINKNKVGNYPLDSVNPNKGRYKKIIAHLPLNGASILDGVDLLPPLSDEAEEWARSQWSCEPGDYEELYYDGLEMGYNAAKQKYQYTEEDMRKAFEAGQLDKGNNWYGGDFNEFIQSHQPKMPIGFILEAKDTHIQNGVIVQSRWIGEYIY